MAAKRKRKANLTSRTYGRVACTKKNNTLDPTYVNVTWLFEKDMGCKYRDLLGFATPNGNKR